MKLKLTDKIKNYRGEVVKQEGVDLTLLDIFDKALNNFLSEEKPTAEVKAKAYQISKKLYSSNEVNLTTSEAAFIVERVDKIFLSPLVCGRVKEILGDS